MSAKFATLVAASIMGLSEGLYGRYHDERTNRIASGHEDLSMTEAELISGCECKSQNDGEDVIFGATTCDGTFGWCEYAPDVRSACPSCCPTAAAPLEAPSECECQSQIDGGDMIFGAFTRDRTFGWCEFAPDVLSECPQCCPGALPPSLAKPPPTEQTEDVPTCNVTTLAQVDVGSESVDLDQNEPYQSSQSNLRCECKSQVRFGGDVILGASMIHRGSFGWCEHAPAVAVECPHCCTSQLDGVTSRSFADGRRGFTAKQPKQLSETRGFVDLCTDAGNKWESFC